MAELTTVASLYLLWTSDWDQRPKCRRVWAHNILQKRTQLGEYHHLLQPRLDDGRFQRYFRLTLAQFEDLLARMGARISRLDTNYRSCIPAVSGCIDGVVGVAARVASVQAPWLTLEEEPSPDLTSHIAGLETMLSEMQLRVPVAFWSVEATQPAWAEACAELDEPDDTLEDLMEVEVVSNSNSNKMVACCQPPCWGLGCVG